MGGARRADRQGERGRGQGGGIPHGNRPRPQQIALNSRIAACRDPTEVFEEVVKAGEINVRLNSVNLATALHRVAKTAQGRGPFQNLQQDPVYLSLLRMVEKGLLPNSGEFNPREIANTAWGIAKAGGTSPSTFKALAEGSAHRTLAGFKPQELANTVWAFATAITGTSGQERLLLATSVDQMLTLAENEIVQRRAYHNADTEGGLADFKPQELSNTIWAFSTVGRHDSGVYAAVVEEMKRRNLPDFVPQDLANSVWAIVTAGHACPELLAQVQEDALKRGIASFKTQEIANMVWALAKADHPIHPLLASVASDVRKRKLAAFQPQELSNIVWAFATQAFKAESLLDVVEEELLRRGLTAFKSQEIANTAWAFAKLGHTAEALFQTMEDEILGNRDLEAFVPQELANMLWSFAKLDHGSETVFQELSGEMLRRGLSTFKTQELSNAVWAHATNGHAYPGLFLAVETEALRRGINAFTPQDLANMVWAFGKADHVAALLFESLQREFEIIGQTDRGLSTFKPQELSNILWACAKTQHSAKCHFNKLEASARGVFTHAQGDAEDFSGRDDTTSVVLEVDKELFRYARTGRAAELMFEAVEEELLRRDLSVFNTQHLANIAWAFVFLKFSRFHKLSLSGTRLLVAVSLASDSRVNEFAIEELRQLGQVVLATRKRAAREMGFAKKVNEALRRYHLDMDAPESSIFHQEVSSVLRALGVPHHNEVKVFEGVYHIDVVVGKGTPTDPKGHIAIEVDGPTHFCAGSEEPNPHTALKRWLLRREGYRVISVPFFDWRTLQSEAVRRAYVEHRLTEIGWDMARMELDESTSPLQPTVL